MTIKKIKKVLIHFRLSFIVFIILALGLYIFGQGVKTLEYERVLLVLDVEEELYTNQQTLVQYRSENADNFKVKAKYGEVEENVYTAPNFETTDTITVKAKNEEYSRKREVEVDIVNNNNKNKEILNLSSKINFGVETMSRNREYKNFKKAIGYEELKKYSPEKINEDEEKQKIMVVDEGNIKNGNNRNIINKTDIESEHGEEVTSVLENISNAEVYYYSIDADRSLISTMTELRNVIDKANKKDIDLINMSFGANTNLVKKQIKKLFEMQLSNFENDIEVIVSASNDEDEKGIFASSVKTISAAGINENRERVFSQVEEMDFSATATNVEINNKKISGNSYSAPAITAIISHFLAENPNLQGDTQKITRELSKYSTKIDELCNGVPNLYRMYNDITNEDIEIFLVEVDHENESITRRSENADINKNGEFVLSKEIDEDVNLDDYKLIAHVDVNENGKVDAGDYFKTIETLEDTSKIYVNHNSKDINIRNFSYLL